MFTALWRQQREQTLLNLLRSYFLCGKSHSRDSDDNDLMFTMLFNKDHVMYAYCATELVNPASVPFEWERARVVWKLVYLCALTTSRYSLWSCRDEMGSFLFLESFHSVCLSELKTIRMRLIAEWSYRDGGSSAVNEFLAALLLGQFEYVFLIGLWRLRLLFSAFLKSVCMMWLCWAEEPGSNGVHLKPGEHAHYLQPKARLI